VDTPWAGDAFFKTAAVLFGLAPTDKSRTAASGLRTGNFVGRANPARARREGGDALPTRVALPAQTPPALTGPPAPPSWPL